MPVYEFYCKDCNREFEVQMRLSEYEKQSEQHKCKNCDSSNTERRISMFEAKTSRKS
ncbi:zinc ribbon domain-containing protein [Desulfonatronospira sp.]|uniref:FmdB family zinc ribbon protein n=1 Tax=Desulfonatronospira sp. TaxID=1962951 RepID=UPI0025BE9D9C|nr:zinc ribbon domain-containing protein [Desulfonatronospira sp.]